MGCRASGLLWRAFESILDTRIHLSILFLVLGSCFPFSEAEMGEGEKNQSLGIVLGSSIACSLDDLHATEGILVSPTDDDPRPAVLKKEASLIYRLPNSVIKKVVPVTESASPEEARRRLRKELAVLSAFSLYRHFPRVLSVDLSRSTIYMDDAGPSLTVDNVPCDWRQQILAILHILKQNNIFHNDWLGLSWPDSPNLCVRGGTLSLIDFTWATHREAHYPFMNPTEQLVYQASDLWDMLHRTRAVEEEQRLRYQNVRDLYKQRNQQAVRERLPIKTVLSLHRVLDRVGDAMTLTALNGAAVGLAEAEAEGVRVRVRADDLHPWCFVHCGDCTLSVVLDNAETVAHRPVCECPKEAGIRCQLVVSVWGLEEGTHVLEATATGRIGEGGDEAWWEAGAGGEPDGEREFTEVLTVQFTVEA